MLLQLQCSHSWILFDRLLFFRKQDEIPLQEMTFGARMSYVKAEKEACRNEEEEEEDTPPGPGEGGDEDVSLGHSKGRPQK